MKLTGTTEEISNLTKLAKRLDGLSDYQEGIDGEAYMGEDCLYFELGSELGWSRDEDGEDPGYDSITFAVYEEDGTETSVDFESCSFGDAEEIIQAISKALLGLR